MRRIVVMGDSQAYRLMRYMLYVISRLGGVICTMTADEAHLRAAYYNVSYTVTGRLSCSGCDSFRATCKSAINSVEIEYLRLAFTLDSELTTAPRMHFDGNCRHGQLPPCKWFWSSQQFLFEGYLRQRQPPPDHIHIFQNMHDCSRRSPADHRRDLSWFVDLLNATLLNGTSVHFWEAPHPNGAKQPEAWRNVTSPACMRMMNDAMRQAIAPFVERTALAPNASARSGHAAWYGAFDLFSPTGARLDLNVDGVHMRGDWYEALARAVIAGTCGLG
ncbi:hypothetical protein MNEG_5293 [Monoraphidium neglectum]|uniref:Uncharacterized protein n=1 Tax=Monoraphidium neglectum TaxID=145388 RepID=A0A0D2MQH2_9CHLO|nr:hypothetical protein MNEG_5293 [Monoraphidium neglectum]KIZ02667.1 hypothetical protein MNEG_5293 [Monoraphidium neglectum]|eukprot:XP_013901686.1 hypothetical protein MNEG_5293 [Monoraphidium neglectum]